MKSPPPRKPSVVGSSPDNDLQLELYRQQTLLTIMTGRMRETSVGLERASRIDAGRIRQALGIHRRYLLELRYIDEGRVAKALAHVEAAASALAECAKEHRRAVDFQQQGEAMVASGVAAGSPEVKRLAKMFREEADRIDQHQMWEQEHLHAKLDHWLPESVRIELLGEMRRFDAKRAEAEIALVSWSTQLSQSSD